MVDGRTFYWRLVKVIKHVKTEADRTIRSNPHIQLYDTSFRLPQDMLREATKTVTIYNKSEEEVTLNTCEISSKSGLIRLERSIFDVKLFANDGKFTIFMKIAPKTVGSFVEEIVADFGEFQKKCLVSFDVFNDRNGGGHHARNGNNDELIPGQRVRNSPRFIDIRIKDYTVPNDFRDIDFKTHIDLVLEGLYTSYPFVFEELDRGNYVAKMRCCLYMEEIAMEIQFAKYRIDRGHFENKQEFLRLEIEGVAERRPSLSIGDSVRATELIHSQTSAKKPTYEGCIHKVEHNSILLKFHPDFHRSHNRRDHRIDFFFSRSTYRRQQHALDKAVSQIGIGYDFLFPLLRGSTKRPQVDANLKLNNSIDINGKEYPFFNDKLNIYQKQAVINILRGVCRPLPYIIYGPPGKNSSCKLNFIKRSSIRHRQDSNRHRVHRANRRQDALVSYYCRCAIELSRQHYRGATDRIRSLQGRRFRALRQLQSDREGPDSGALEKVLRNGRNWIRRWKTSKRDHEC